VPSSDTRLLWHGSRPCHRETCYNGSWSAVRHSSKIRASGRLLDEMPTAKGTFRHRLRHTPGVSLNCQRIGALRPASRRVCCHYVCIIGMAISRAVLSQQSHGRVACLRHEGRSGLGKNHALRWGSGTATRPGRSIAVQSMCGPTLFHTVRSKERVAYSVGFGQR